MSEFFISPNTGCRLKYTVLGQEWDIVVGFVNTYVGAFFSVLLDTEDGYRQLGLPIDGPFYDTTALAAAVNAAPGTGGNPMGRYLIWKMPDVQQRLNAEFDPSPATPADWNTAPITTQNLNIALREYFKLQPDTTGGNAPTFKQV